MSEHRVGNARRSLISALTLVCTHGCLCTCIYTPTYSAPIQKPFHLVTFFPPQDEYELYMAALLDSQPTAQYKVATTRKGPEWACMFMASYLGAIEHSQSGKPQVICSSVMRNNCFFFLGGWSSYEAKVLWVKIVAVHWHTARGHSLTTTHVTREGHKWYCSDSQEIASCCYPEWAHCHSRCTQSHNTDLSLLV